MPRDRSRLFAVIFAVALTAFTAYALLDTFVIARSYDTVQVPDRDTERGDDSGDTPLSPSDDRIVAMADEVIGTYTDERIALTVTTHRIERTQVYVADVRLSSLDYLRTAFAENTYGKNIKQTTSAIAAQHNAILAINGDFYGARNDGYVVRDGVIYRDITGRYEDGFAIMENGSFTIFDDLQITAQELVANGARDVFAFGPGLLENGKITVDTHTEVGISMSSNPRTAIAMIEPLHYLLVVSDGRTSESAGLSLYELAAFLQSLGADTAYNLDGGGSSTMVFQGEVINKPTHSGKKIEEREVSDIVYIG